MNQKLLRVIMSAALLLGAWLLTRSVPMPVSQVLTSLINFFIQAAMYLIFWVYFFATGSGVHLTLWLLAVPFVILEVMLRSM